MTDPHRHNPYYLDPADTENPPTTLLGVFRRIGPGLILASAIVGSGELIATTVLGAENGYTLLWLILVSCVIKVVIQNELGRYTIGTGETTLEALDRIPGPRFRVSWVVWLWFVSLCAVLFSTGGMLGAIGEVLHTIVPAVPINAWVWVVNLGTVVLLIVGRYALVEKVSMGLVVSFTVLTVSCAFLLLQRPEYFSWSSMLVGLTFQMPQGGLSTAVTVFGATGVGAGELIIYPYWCIEKGYARFTGTRDGSQAWRQRALGWIDVMGFDVLNSMVIYTFATVAFYLLGAGILHGMGVVPAGTDMVATLSNMYTEVLGGWSQYLFLMGAIVVFYSTVFAVTASHSRLAADFLGLLRTYDRHNYAKRLQIIRLAVVILLVLPSISFMFLQEPVLMVKIGGMAQAFLLPIVGLSTIYLRYVHLPGAIAPKVWITLALWVTSAITLVMMVYSLILQVVQWCA